MAEIGATGLAASVQSACGALGCAEAHPYNIAVLTERFLVSLTAQRRRPDSRTPKGG